MAGVAGVGLTLAEKVAGQTGGGEMLLRRGLAMLVDLVFVAAAQQHFAAARLTSDLLSQRQPDVRRRPCHRPPRLAPPSDGARRCRLAG